MNPTPASARFPFPEPSGGEEALLEAIRRRDAAATERLLLQWVHRRGLASLEHLGDTILGWPEGEAAALWFTDRLGGEALPAAQAAGSEAILPEFIAPETIEMETLPPRTAPIGPTNPFLAAPQPSSEGIVPDVSPLAAATDPSPLSEAMPVLASDGDPASPSLEIERAFDDLAAAFPLPPAASRPAPAMAEAPLLSQEVSWQPGSSPDPFEAFSLEPLSFDTLPLAGQAPGSTAPALSKLQPLEVDSLPSPDREDLGATASPEPQGRGAALRRPLQGGLGALRRVKSLMRDCLDEALGTFQPDRPEGFDESFEDEGSAGPSATGHGTGGSSRGDSPTAVSPTAVPSAAISSAAQTPAAESPAHPALPAGVEPARSPRVRPDGKPAPAPSSLDELRSWLPDDDLPRAC